MSELPDVEVGDAYALRTFNVKNGRLVSITVGGGHWVDGICEAVCLVNSEHVAPVKDCSCGVYAWWTVDKLLDQYQSARRMVVVIRMEGECIEGESGVKANAAQIVAYWCAEDADELAAAAAASAPGASRYFDRDVMIGLYPPPTAEGRE